MLIRAAKQEKETEIDQLPLELSVIDFISDYKGQFEVKKNDKIIEVDGTSKEKEEILEVKWD